MPCGVSCLYSSLNAGGWGCGCIQLLAPFSQPEVNHMPLEGPFLKGPGYSLFGLSGVLTVGRSRCMLSHTEAQRVRGWNGREGRGWEGVVGMGVAAS